MLLPRPLRATARALLPALALLACTAGPAAATDTTGTDSGASPKVLVVGDSLAVGMKPFLADDLGEPVAWDAKSGRTTPEGLIALRAALRQVQPLTVVISLGTNDGSSPQRFDGRIHKALAAIPAGACIVWATVYRPARKGPFPQLNRVLRTEATLDPRLTLVNWDWVVARGAVNLPDGLHPDSNGFHLRSRLIADAIRRGCATDVGSTVGATSAPYAA
jgi:lysophospholipase L1-like esterase